MKKVFKTSSDFFFAILSPQIPTVPQPPPPSLELRKENPQNPTSSKIYEKMRKIGEKSRNKVLIWET